ncbi:hypothetical protein RAJCM14343_3122 [Rhodococcus aetherivorans]|uniref:Uncharacterized protein n=1 Tax=Rhodococcus aetherivorans TaxID=191292 RepID=A0ABQ0YMQ5_9NOCA|nr:hypothetical protein RAJCM14343_3122 [Rhodococcus aetherivorans]
MSASALGPEVRRIIDADRRQRSNDVFFDRDGQDTVPPGASVRSGTA